MDKVKVLLSGQNHWVKLSSGMSVLNNERGEEGQPDNLVRNMSYNLDKNIRSNVLRG